MPRNQVTKLSERSENIIRSVLRFPVFTKCRVFRPHAVFLLAAMALCQSCATPRAKIEDQRATLESEKQAAIQEVQRIVNQPVRQLTPTDDMRVSTYRPGWFHEGAVKPDFNNVDVRTTQETSYGQQQYVTSDLNPGVVFMGSEVEFNSMTKYFYVDRSLPKKKLADEEMIEINRLYRIIGRCEKQLADLQK
jgi:hypothetical protein